MTASHWLHHHYQSEDSSLVSFSHNQNSNGSTNVVFKAVYSWKHFLNQPITFTQYCLHHTIRYGYSANPTIAHCLPHTSCWLDLCFEIEWLDWYFSWKAFQILKKKNVSTASTENQVICSTDTAVIQKRQVASFVYWFRYFYANSVELFLHQSSYSICPWIRCDSVVPAGESLHRRSSWLSHLALYWFLFLFGIQVKLWHLSFLSVNSLRCYSNLIYSR